MTASLAARLRRLAEDIPAGGSLVLGRDALLDLAASAGEVEGGGDLTVAQAAARLGCSPSHVRRLLESRRLGGYKLPGGAKATWRVPPAALGRLRAGDPAEGDHQGGRTNLAAWRHVAPRRGTA